MKRPKEEYKIQSVVNALELLEQFKGERAELGISELSRILGLHKNSVFRLAATLESQGYLEQNRATENYRLGIKALELGKAFLSHTGLVRVASEKLRALSSQVNETCYLGILRDDMVFYIEGVESTQPLRVASRIGTRLSPLCTAIGKVMLAYVAEQERNQIISRSEFKVHTPCSILDQGKYEEELRGVIAQGYALEREEKDLGVINLAAPIFDYNHQVVAAVSISGPITRMTEEALRETLIPHLLNSAEEISQAIGYTKK